MEINDKYIKFNKIDNLAIEQHLYIGAKALEQEQDLGSLGIFVVSCYNYNYYFVLHMHFFQIYSECHKKL